VRYKAVSRELFDENQSGGNDQVLECRELNVRLMLGTDDREGYEQLPIAQVKRAAGDIAAPQLDDRYIPPVLSVDAWLHLGRGIVRGIHDLLIQEINELVEQLRDVKLRDQILEVSQSGRFALLDRLNESSVLLGVMLPANGIHPLVSYADFCRIIGQLAVFTRQKRVPELPRYDHDNLGPVFIELASLIRMILESIRFKDYMQKNFVWEGNIMQADLTPSWFDPNVDWYIGVERAEAVSDAECRKLLSHENAFLWKFGSKDRDIYSLGALGLKLRGVERVPPTLPPHQHWTYWHVPKDDADPVYRAISKNQLVAAFMSDGKNRPYEPSQYAGSSRFPVFNRRDELIEFQLSLFGVRR
jgi:type VI secretion system protein ImpJ